MIEHRNKQFQLNAEQLTTIRKMWRNPNNTLVKIGKAIGTTASTVQHAVDLMELPDRSVVGIVHHDRQEVRRCDECGCLGVHPCKACEMRRRKRDQLKNRKLFAQN